MKIPSLKHIVQDAHRKQVQINRFAVTLDEAKRIREAETRGHDEGLRTVLKILREKNQR